MSNYSSLQRAQLTYDYLHTNSTTHEFLFGALAELVDNARDAGATRIEVFPVPNESVRGKNLLCFLDDGDGMDPSEVANIVQFGRSAKRKVDSNMIGQYGNGLKSGTMRIGKDMILFTKKAHTMSALFLSRTFHEREGIEEVVVPMPSWESKTKKPLAKHKRETERHQIELNLILKYSPFKTEGELLQQFDKIKNKGTLVICYNLKLLDNGEPELDMTSDPSDILMADTYASEIYSDVDGVMPERKSFRAYTSILYLDPRMKIYIKERKVQTKRLIASLYKTRCYNYVSKRFKTRSEKEAEKAVLDAKIANENARELETQARELQSQSDQTSKDMRAAVRKAQEKASESRAQAEMKGKLAEAKQKSLKEPKTLSFTFGFNIERRRCYGMFIYNCNRLIRMYEKVGPQMEGGVKCYGVIGVVDVPYLVLEPTHNKQDFADGKEYKHLTRALGEHLAQYWKDSRIEQCGVTKFWEDFGYVSSKWTDDPSTEIKYARKRAMQIPLSIQCDYCLKWRELPFSQRNIGREFPEEWCCAMSSDPSCSSCSRPEQKMSIQQGVLHKQLKSDEDKARKVEEQIQRKTEQLQQLQANQKAISKESTRRQQVSVKPVQRTPAVVTPKTIKSKPTAKLSPITRKPSVEQQEVTITEKRESQVAKKDVGKRTTSLASLKITPTRRTPSVDSSDSEAIQKSPSAKNTVVDSTVDDNIKTNQKKRTFPSRTPSSEEAVKAKRKKDVVTSNSQTRSDGDEMEWSSSEELTSPHLTSADRILPKVGDKVEARTTENKWYVGTVVMVKPKEGEPSKAKIKFDQYPKNKYDKWFESPFDDIRILHAADEESLPSSPSSSPTSPPEASREVHSTTSTELPGATVSSRPDRTPLEAERSYQAQSPDGAVTSVSTATETHSSELVHDVSGLLRRCLCYFAPPSFNLRKEEIKELTPEDLKSFQLDKFFDEYEEGLTQLINKYQTDKEAALARVRASEMKLKRVEEDATITKAKLINLRRTGAKLIRSLNEDPEDMTLDLDSDHVDSMLDAIACQAERRS